MRSGRGQRIRTTVSGWRAPNGELYRPDRDAAYERGLAAKEYVARIMRGVQQDMEAMAGGAEPPVEDLSRKLRDE